MKSIFKTCQGSSRFIAFLQLRHLFPSCPCLLLYPLLPLIPDSPWPGPPLVPFSAFPWLCTLSHLLSPRCLLILKPPLALTITTLTALTTRFTPGPHVRAARSLLCCLLWLISLPFSNFLSFCDLTRLYERGVSRT